jgi:hypothetical protein
MTRRNPILPFAIAVFLAGCSSPKPPDSKVEAKICEEPENPYSEGTGHSAGYEWAERNRSGSCDASSQSFNEGCEEYENQDTAYEECQASKKE